MFDTLSPSLRQQTSRNQVLFPAFLLAGAVLNALSDFARPPHTHQGVWFWLGLLGPALMMVGVFFSYRVYRESRGKRSLDQANTKR